MSDLPTVSYLGVPVWRWFAFECPKGHRWARLMEDRGDAPYSRCPACRDDELHRAEVVVAWAEAPTKQRGAQAATSPAEPEPKPKRAKPGPKPKIKRSTEALVESAELVRRTWRTANEWAECAEARGWATSSSRRKARIEGIRYGLNSLCRSSGWERRGKGADAMWRQPERQPERKTERQPERKTESKKVTASYALEVVASTNGDALGWLDRDGWAGWAESAGWSPPSSRTDRLAVIEAALGRLGWPSRADNKGQTQWRPSGRLR